jgi:hypothetical protein
VVVAKREEMWRCCLYLESQGVFAKGASTPAAQLRKLRTACLHQPAPAPKRETDIFGIILTQPHKVVCSPLCHKICIVLYTCIVQSLDTVFDSFIKFMPRNARRALKESTSIIRGRKMVSITDRKCPGPGTLIRHLIRF